MDSLLKEATERVERKKKGAAAILEACGNLLCEDDEGVFYMMPDSEVGILCRFLARYLDPEQDKRFFPKWAARKLRKFADKIDPPASEEDGCYFETDDPLRSGPMIRYNPDA